MFRDTALFNILHRELVDAFEEHRDIDADMLATMILENDGDNWLVIGLIEDAQAVLTYNRVMESITKTPIENDRLDGNAKHQIDRQRSEGQVVESIQGLGPEFFAWIHPRYCWVFTSEH